MSLGVLGAMVSSDISELLFSSSLTAKKKNINDKEKIL